MPSMIPSCAGPAPSDARKAGSTQYAISLAVSLRNEVRPKTYIFRGIFRAIDGESGGGGASMSVHENSMGTEQTGRADEHPTPFALPFTSYIAVTRSLRSEQGKVVGAERPCLSMKIAWARSKRGERMSIQHLLHCLLPVTLPLPGP